MSSTLHQTDHCLAPADGIVLGGDGIWYSREQEKISYLEEGNAVCFELEERSFWFAHRANCIRALAQRFRPPGMVFDIGGGNGFVANKLQEADFEVAVVEPGAVGARNARSRGIQTVICSTLASAKFRARSMPAAGLFDVLEHIEDDAGFLGEIHRCMVPKGLLYITVPAFGFLWSDDDVAAGHFRRYTRASLEERVAAAGFKPLYSSCIFSVLPAAVFTLRSIPSLFGRRRLPRRKYAALHQPRGAKFIDRVWAAELRRLERGDVIPIGSSCIMAAQKC